jgi:hypothetical protein
MVELVGVLHDCQAAISPSSKMIGLLLSAALVTGRRCACINVQRATCTWHYHIPHASLRVRSSPPSVFYFATMSDWKRHTKNIQNKTWCNIQHRRFLGAGTRCSVPRPCLSATCHCIYATATSTRCPAKPRRAYPQRACAHSTSWLASPTLSSGCLPSVGTRPGACPGCAGSGSASAISTGCLECTADDAHLGQARGPGPRVASPGRGALECIELSVAEQVVCESAIYLCSALVPVSVLRLGQIGPVVRE